jgi:tetratricopeptide (TPR) repeat protein
MSSNDISEMIKRLLTQEDLPREFFKLVYEKTRGNPFFVEEVIKSLKEDEVIYREKNKWNIKEISEIKFPETVKDVIRTRLSRLDDECQRVLTMASFAGKDFTFEALRGITGVEENKLVEIMEKMLNTGLIKERVIRGEDTCSFADIIVRDVVYEEVSRLKRKRIHGDVGQALENVYAENIEQHLGELALHFLEGGDKEKALDYFLKAGERAANVYANSEAASYFQSSLRILGEKEDRLPERARVLERIGDIKKLVGESGLCGKYWNDALRLWKELREKRNAARLHRKLANVLWEEIGDTEEAKKHHDSALKILGTSPESIELASLYEEMAHMYYRIGGMTEASSWVRKALELAKKLNAHEVIASSYATLGTIFSFTGEVKKAVECHERALTIALDKKYMETALRTYNNLASALTAGQSERILDYHNKGFELAKKVGHISFQSWIAANSALSHLNMGNMEKALLLAEEAVALDRKTGNAPHLSMALGGLGYVHQVQGEWDRSEHYYTEALSIAEKLSDWQSIGFCYWGLGWFYFNKGEYMKAKELYEKALEVAKKADAKHFEATIKAQGIALTSLELGEIRKARNIADNVHKFALEVKDRELLIAIDVLKGMIFRAQRKWENSIKHFDKSLQESEALEARRWNVYIFAKMVLSQYARVFLERNHEGDREKAKELLNQALGIFQKMGAKKDLEMTRSKLASLETGSEMAKPELMTEISLPTHASTGYDDLNGLLRGGVPRGYAVILTSPSCDERDSLIEKFLEAGAKEGQVAFYITTKTSGLERLIERFQSNIHIFVCNPQADKIFTDMRNVTKLKGVENLNDINIALTSAIRKIDASSKGLRRICLHVSDILLQHDAVQARRWLNALIPELKSNGFTTLAVIDSEIHTQQEVRAIVGIFDGEISIYEKETEKGPEKFLKIKKLTNQKYSKSELSLKEEKAQE